MKIETLSPGIWIVKSGIVNEMNKPISFRDRLFLYDIVNDMSKNQCVKKCSQIGGSVIMNLKVYHICKNRGMNIIYTMPSDSDVWEFVQTKTDKIFQNNAEIRNSLKTSNTQFKQIGDRFVYFKGTRSKAAPISTTADILIHDEIDRSDLQIIESYQSRITASNFKGTWELSNPSFTNVGIDVSWKQSDKKEWFMTCPFCGHEQTLTWDNNVDEINAIIVCANCKKELKERRIGHWKKTGEGSVSGYHISQLMASWWTAKDLIEVREKRGEEYFYNFMLGEPYNIGEVENFRQMILDNWIDTPIDSDPYFMGIDVGKIKHYVLGSAKGVFKIGAVQSREELEAIIKRYNPTIVIDSGPERTWVEELRSKYPKTHLCFYHMDKDQKEMIKWGGLTKTDIKNAGYVWVDRNRTIDKVISEMLKGNISFYLNRDILEKFILHWENMQRIIEERTDGTKRYVWTHSGPDHWCHSLLYYYLARLRGGTKTEFLPDTTSRKEIFEITSEGFRMTDLKDLI